MKNYRLATGQDKLLPNFTKFFFNRPRLTAVLFLALAVFGVLSYTTLLKREGFPSVNVPFAIITGTYSSEDPEKVDSAVAKQISDVALKQKEVSVVQSQSGPNFFTVSVQYKENANAQSVTDTIKKAVNDSGKIPSDARVQYNVPNFGVTGGDIEKIDLTLSFYANNNNADTQTLYQKAEVFAKELTAQKAPGVKRAFVKNPFATAVNPLTGQEVEVQRSFDRYGQRQNGNNTYYSSVLIGVEAVKNEDVIKLDNHVREALAKVQAQPQFAGFTAQISASYAPSIKESISELQRVLLEGLIAVLVIGSIIIAVRASLITVLSMLTVLLIVTGLLYLVGYSLNVITLFALILGLSLIVDDTIIMVEAIDAARRRQKTPQEVVVQASRKVSRAMVAATTTAALSFAPLLFVGGILGGFIRAIPVTIISALIISLFVALIFIPFFARFILLGKKQLGEKGVVEVAAGFEAGIARGIAKPMLWARGHTRRLFTLGVIALVVGFGFIFAGLSLAQKVVFNIFPPTKDTNALVLQLAYPGGTTIEDSQKIAAQADKIAARALGENFVDASYYNSGSSDSAMQMINIISYEDRDVTSPQLVKELQKTFDRDFKQAKVTVGQADVGPPSSSFIVQIEATNRSAALKAANDLASYMQQHTLKRVSGKTAHFENVAVSSSSQVIRSAGKPIIRVSSGFDGNDTTTLVTLAQDDIKKVFTPEKMASYGLDKDSLSFDLGQESENQDSFKSLAIAFPILLCVIFIVLAFQFRSLLQPLLIFMAIPFSIFGVMFGLYITDNPISFFAMLGFFALIGLSIKNTILLTDFANQTRRAGGTPVEAAVAALEERFRPLIATSITAVVSLIPLAITSPFWQGLAVVLIFGLISSTLLVITVFPYYYLGAEYLRARVSRKAFFSWLAIVVLVAVLVSQVANPAAGIAGGVALASAYFAGRRYAVKRR